MCVNLKFTSLYELYDPFFKKFEKSNVIIDEPQAILTRWWKIPSNHPWEPLPSHPPGLYKDPKEPETFGGSSGSQPPLLLADMLTVQAHGPYKGVSLLLSSLGAQQAVLP